MQYVTGTPTTVTATNSTGAALAANNSRRYAIIRNMGSVTVFLAIGVTAEANKGIPVKAGEAYEMTAQNLSLSAINCITASSTAALCILEGV